MDLIENYILQRMLAHEGFLRRAAALDLPFMLKGSYVTRQYMDNPDERIPGDLDWVYLGHLPDGEEVESRFNAWAIAVTDEVMHDGIEFKPFRNNAFWRMVDYAMDDDFPTVNTDIECNVDGTAFYDFSLDVSFNLPVEVPPVPLLYKPLRGEPFILPYTVPLALQVSWKLHQTLVRPRFKDMFDLIYLLRHPDFDNIALAQAIQALVNECAADKVDLKRLGSLLDGDAALLFPGYSMKEQWSYWRHKKELRYTNQKYYESAALITDPAQLPELLPSFLEQFNTALSQAGLGRHLMNTLPAPERHSRKTGS